MFKTGVLDVQGKKFILKFGKEYLVGRKSKEYLHDIEIDDPSVDIKHSLIDLTQTASPLVFDVCSKNGTYIDGVQILRFHSATLSETTKLRFGNVDTSLQFLVESDSGFLEQRFNSSTKDTSDIICNTPEQIVSSGSRLKNSLKSSLTSTPNISTATSTPNASKSIDNFLIPSCLPRSSIGSNTSARSADSFYIPETQHVPEAITSKTNNTTDISVHSNTSKKNSTAGDDDFFIPETQEVINLAIPLPNHARVAFPSDDVNETLSQEDRIPSSQFRICTQDFNGSDEDLSNHSGDILANVPLSMIIPPIQHATVQVDDFVKDEEDEMDKEMSALQWSKKTVDDDADGSVTPDDLFDVVGSVTSDLIQVKSTENAVSQASTPDIFANPEELEDVERTSNIENMEKVDKGNVWEDNKISDAVENNKNLEILSKERNISEGAENDATTTKEASQKNQTVSPTEIDYPPTQAFFKPIPKNKSIVIPDFEAPPVREYNGSEDDSDFLPETQAFTPPTAKPKPVVSNSLVKPQISPASNSNFLPETQVFTPPTTKPKPVVLNALVKPQISPASNTNKPNNSTTLPNLGKNHVFALPFASPRPSPKPLVSPRPQALPRPQASPKPKASPKPQESHKPSTSAVPADEDDLPPTQVFLKEDHAPLPIITNVCFSSTLVDNDMQLSENSFKAKFNKLLDSDDDEMDEVVAPELVKQMRLSLENPAQPVGLIEIPLTPEDTPTVPSKETENTPADKNSPTPASTPDNTNFRLPVKAPKTGSKAPAVSIDNFMLTPDFLGKEFSKNSQLQREAEVNWRNLVLEKRTKALFGEDKDGKLINSDSDESQDSFIDLLPNRKEIRSKSVNKSENEKVEQPKKVEEEAVCGRITRRKSTLQTDAKQGAKKTNSITKEEDDKKEIKRRGRKKKELQTSETKDQKPEAAKASKESKIDVNEKISKKEKKSKSDKELKTEKEKKVENDSKTEKKPSRVKDDKDAKIVKNSAVAENSSVSRNSSSMKDCSLAKSNSVKEDKLSEKPSFTKESSSNKNSSAIKHHNEVKPSPTVSRDSSLTRSTSTTSVNTSKELKEKIESSKKPSNERTTRTRRKVEEPIKVEEKSSKSKAVKRNAEVTKTSSKASKINKLDEIDVMSKSKQADDKPSPRITRLRSNADLKAEEKKVTLNNNREKRETMKKDAVKKEAAKNDALKKDESTKKESAINNNRTNESLIDLTDSDVEDKTIVKKPSRKRKSQEEYNYKGRISEISGSQSSVNSSDSDRTLRRKKKMKIAMTSSSPATREALIRYSGRVWDYTEDPKECDVLIVEVGNRTYKLLVAIARGVPVVKVDWLKEVISLRSTDVSFDKYLFDEPNFQKRHKFLMRDVLQLARTVALFKDLNFMMTPNIVPQPDEMKDIITCAGGTVLTNIPTGKNDQPFYLVSEKTDSQLWYRYRRASQNVKVVTATSLMAAVMQQSLDPLIESIR
ncbi:nucleolar protein dao-5 [Episyrphus balteatus]|uniref:nucleolar protein dao-5 n=1 Tax=Episyrphus balteatus TaxID=286459 RepID=UPI002484E3AB|nr:nucleolar protein dao-5 [Episyrphus balteatus]